MVQSIHVDEFAQNRENPDFLGFYVEPGAITRKEEKMIGREWRKYHDLKLSVLEVLYKTRGYVAMQKVLEEGILRKE